ncbi:MAG: hypothetical protein ACYCQI_16245, partial [Gammaproteobacteria bacterium]
NLASHAIQNALFAKFSPQDSWHRLFYPFYFSWQGTIADTGCRDFRYPVVYLLFVISGMRWLWKKISGVREDKPNLMVLWLYGFFIFSFVVWEYCFSILRYIVALEMLAPLVICVLLARMIRPANTSLIVIAVVLYFLAVSMHPSSMIRTLKYEATLFNVNMPDFIKTTPQAMVLTPYSVYALTLEPRPQAYLIPFFPVQWRFVGLPFSESQFYVEMNEHETIQQIINQYSGQFYLLTGAANMPVLYRTAKSFGLIAAGECSKISSDRQLISHQEVWLCPVKKR